MYKRVDLISHREWQGWLWFFLFAAGRLGHLPPCRQRLKTKRILRKLSKAEKKRQKPIQKELETPYKKWLDEEVPYIITY